MTEKQTDAPREPQVEDEREELLDLDLNAEESDAVKGGIGGTHGVGPGPGPGG